jgi:hypothetical protein
MLYVLGLSYGAVVFVLTALGVGIGKTRVYRAVQAVARKVPGMKREKLLDGYRTGAVGADVTSVRCKQYVHHNWNSLRTQKYTPKITGTFAFCRPFRLCIVWTQIAQHSPPGLYCEPERLF